jgi:hypothetical protein
VGILLAGPQIRCGMQSTSLGEEWMQCEERPGGRTVRGVLDVQVKVENVQVGAQITCQLTLCHRHPSPTFLFRNYCQRLSFQAFDV